MEDRSLASVLRQGLRAVGAVSAIPNENETPGGALVSRLALAGAMSQKPNNGSGHAAAHISERLGGFGFYVFPIVPGSKVPATRHGLLDATRDPEKIKRFWSTNTRTTTSASDAARSQTSSSSMLMIAAGAWTVSMRSRLNMAPTVDAQRGYARWRHALLLLSSRRGDTQYGWVSSGRYRCARRWRVRACATLGRFRAPV